MAFELEPLIREKAKENERARKGKQRGTSPQISANLSPVDTRDELAKAASVSSNTVSKAGIRRTRLMTLQTANPKGERGSLTPLNRPFLPHSGFSLGIEVDGNQENT